MIWFTSVMWKSSFTWCIVKVANICDLIQLWQLWNILTLCGLTEDSQFPTRKMATTFQLDGLCVFAYHSSLILHLTFGKFHQQCEGRRSSTFIGWMCEQHYWSRLLAIQIKVHSYLKLNFSMIKHLWSQI